MGRLPRLHNEFFLMDANGTGVEQLTWFNTLSSPEFGDAMFGEWNLAGTQLLIHNGTPEIQVPGGNSVWLLTFAGACGWLRVDRRAAHGLAMGGSFRAPLSMANVSLVWVVAFLAVMDSTLICVVIQDLVPTGHGPELFLFPYNRELVAVGVVGGVVPVLTALGLAAAFAARRGDDPAPFRSAAYWSAILVIALILTAFFSVSTALNGGLGVPRQWAFWLVLAGGVAGVDYWWLRGRSLGVAAGTAECYAMGTLAVFASDVIRTLSGLASAPGEAAVWGGGGFLDITFWFGIYVALAFVSLRVFLSVISQAMPSARTLVDRPERMS